MDLLHEELKEQVMEVEEDPQAIMAEETMEEDKSQSDVDFQSCESCSSSDKAENENGSRSFSEDNNETTMLIQDDENNSEMSKDWQKEKMCNKINKVHSEGELDKDRDSVSETGDLNNQETVKVQIHSRASGDNFYNLQMIVFHLWTKGARYVFKIMFVILLFSKITIFCVEFVTS